MDALQLTKGEMRAVLALLRERDEVLRQANEQTAEIGAALDELRMLYARVRNLDGERYRLAGDARGLRLEELTPEGDAGADAG